MEDFTLMLDNWEVNDVVYLHYKKAFDSVLHEGLLTKLEAYEVTGSILKMDQIIPGKQTTENQSWKIAVSSS